MTRPYFVEMTRQPVLDYLPYEGIVDDMKVYDRPFSVDEIQILMT